MRASSSKIDLERFNGLIGDIYDAALDPSCWPDVLKGVIQAVRARSGLLRIQNLRSKEVGIYLTHGLDPEFQRHYKEYYIHLDTLIPTYAQLPPGTVQIMSDLLPPSFFKTEFYNDYALPQSQHHAIGSVLTKNQSQLAVLGLHRSNREENYGPNERSLLELLAPHLQRALEVNRRLWQLVNETNATQETLHRLTVGVILVDAGGKPLFLNKRAEEIVATGDGLTISKETLRAPTWTDTKTLHKLIHEAVRSPLRSGNGMVLSTPRLLCPLSIFVTPVGKALNSGFQFDNSCVAAALFIGHVGEELELSLEILSQLHGLTRAEARLAAALANGHSLEEIATRSNLSLHTVRTQLKSCFRKTGCHRQTELVRLVHCTPAPLIDNDHRNQ